MSGHDEDAPVTESDIRWDSGAIVPRPERMPARLLALISHEELLQFAFGLQDDTEALRTTLQEATRALATVTAQLETTRREVWRLRETSRK